MDRHSTRTLFGLAVLATVFLCVPGTAVPRASASGAAFRVIVNPANAVTSLDRKFLTEAFLKKVTRWGNGDAIHAVDLRPDSDTRQDFTDEVLRRSVGAVKSYWQQLVFSGRDVPPPEVDNDEQVIKYVLRFSGGLGYVSGSASLERVKAIVVR